MERLVIPDLSLDAAWVGMSMSSSECERACLTNCSCIAFTTMNIDGKGTGCLAWYGELMNILQLADEGSDLNVRVDATELGSILHLLAFYLKFHSLFFIFFSFLFFFFFSFS